MTSIRFDPEVVEVTSSSEDDVALGVVPKPDPHEDDFPNRFRSEIDVDGLEVADFLREDEAREDDDAEEEDG